MADKNITWKFQMMAQKDITWKLQMMAQKDITWKIQMMLLKRVPKEKKKAEAKEYSATKHGGKESRYSRLERR